MRGHKIQRMGAMVAVIASALLVVPVPAASAAPVGGISLPFVPDCKGPPVPDMPGQGIAAFFSGAPDTLPPEGDPFAKDSNTTIFEQYGYAGIRFSTYDLGCGPDAARDPSAVVGTALANWMLQLPVALTALTSSITGFAFHPTFLGAFDPTITKVSTALHDSIFATWSPLVLAVLGFGILLKSRRAAMATTAAAIGWSMFVVLLATALFRWPIGAGHLADDTVTGTLGTAVGHLSGAGANVDPGTAVASQVESAIYYRAWLAGTLGSADSATARKYGPDLFRAHALTWREAATVQAHPDSANVIIGAKQQLWKDTAARIQASDPAAYEYLTGRRSETRVGYAVMAMVATFLALPFLLFSSLLLLGCYMIVRLAVMMFPAFATLGAFPAARGLVVGLGRTVGAAVINSIVFGVGAGVTVMVLGLLFAPGNGTPAWLGLILMPLFTFIMWMALRPFRRLTQMVSPHDDHFRNMSGAFGDASRNKGRWLKKAAVSAVGAYTGNIAAAATLVASDEERRGPDTPRAEARPSAEPPPPVSWPAALPAPATAPQNRHDAGDDDRTQGWLITTTGESVPSEPVGPEWIDGEEVYPIYQPAGDETDADEHAGDAA
ncbi:MAG TPA: hypothetical protein VHO29_15390 [Marmoricola sp.]|nr:hypothetical protein [Marmoricola sp.]